jgi:archaemetzincin
VVLAASGKVRSRTRPGGLVQFRTGDIFDVLKEHQPKDAFCIIGVTMEDLYPDEKWNFVFGEATYTERVGVFSFKRFTPSFYNQPWGADSRRLLLRRSCDVLAHEIGHMFGLAHCTYFECVMCGSNHLEESDARPMHACPICLRKLHSSIHFDPVARYRALLAFEEKHDLKDEAEWTKRVPDRLTAP